MSNQIRIDRASTFSSFKKTEEGYLRVRAPIARTGVYSYLLPNGNIQREWIPPETLFNQDSIDSLKLKPVTDKHPSKFVDSSTFKDDSVGYVTETMDQVDDYLYSDFLVTTEDGINSINNGTRQLSPGYECNVRLQAGITPDGERYDAIQENRKYNHLALVDKARGGDTLSFKIDSEIGDVGVEINNKPEENSMAKSVRIDGVDHAIENDAVVEHIASLNKRVDELSSVENQIVELQGKHDAAMAELTTLKETKTDEAEINNRVMARVELIESAKSVVSEIKTDMSDLDIMKAVIEAKFPNTELKLDGYSDEHKAIYLKAHFDAAMLLDKEEISASNREDMKPKEFEEKVDARDAFIDMIESKHEGVK